MTFKLMGILTGSHKQKKTTSAKPIPKRIVQELQTLHDLVTDTEFEEKEDAKTAINSIQYNINSLDHQMRGMFHKGNVMSYKQNDSELVLTLLNDTRIVITSSHLKDHQHYQIFGKTTKQTKKRIANRTNPKGEALYTNKVVRNTVCLLDVHVKPIRKAEDVNHAKIAKRLQLDIIAKSKKRAKRLAKKAA